MKATKELNKIKEFVESNPHNKIQLAMHLGYATTAAIEQWFVRKSIPHFIKKRALQYIERHK